MKGWLLYFCLQLLVFNPLGIGWLVITERRALHANEVLRSVLGPMIGADSVVRTALVVIGVAGGALLVARNRRAVPFVRVYLVVFAVAHFALVSLPWFFGLPPQMRAPIAGALSYRAAVLTVPWVGVWLLYFKYSKRVKLTYGGIPPQMEMLVGDAEAPAQEVLKQDKRSPSVAPDAAQKVLEPSRNAALARRPDVIMQITVHKSGAVSVNGQRVDLDLLGRTLDDLKRREGEVWYYGRKELPDQEPPSGAAKVGARVLDAIMDRELPVRYMDDE